MYIPKRYILKDHSVAVDFIKKYSFATLVGHYQSELHAVHIPIEIEPNPNDLILHAHTAKANPINALIDSDQEVMAIFMEPHAYVSSSWYDHVNVPTWNYIAVHVYGKMVKVSREELLDSLNKLVDRYEDGRPERYNISDMPKDMLEAHLNGLTGFRMKIDRIEAKHKLSQNRNDKNFKVVIDKLVNSDDPLEREIAKEMSKLRPHLE